MIKVQNLGKSFDNRRVVQDLSFAAADGAIELTARAWAVKGVR